MWRPFNMVMRIVSSLTRVAMILMGTIWILQGLNLAFRVGFMVGEVHWAIYGAMLALLGVAEVVWSNTRQRLCAFEDQRLRLCWASGLRLTARGSPGIS
jgi:hypothetical protein